MEIKVSNGRMTKKKREAAEKQEDENSTDSSVRKKLENARDKIAEFSAKALSEEAWALIVEEIRQAINLAKTPEDIEKTINQVRSAASFLSTHRHPDLPQKKEPPKGSLGESLVVEVLKLNAKSILRTGYDSNVIKEPLHILDAQACYLGSLRLLKMKNFPVANRFAREAIGYSELMKAFDPAEAGKKGLAALKNKRAKFRELVAKIANELAPKEGWNSPHAASIEISEHIYHSEEYSKFYKDSGFRAEDPYSTIYSWLLADAKSNKQVKEFKIRLVEK